VTSTVIDIEQRGDVDRPTSLMRRISPTARRTALAVAAGAATAAVLAVASSIAGHWG
jgi:hypothetical protein